jgi:two-component system sensor histidine kinase KdpD
MAGLAYNFFFLRPLYSFTISDPQSVLTDGVLLAVAIVVANLADRLRVRASIGARSAQENAAVAAFGQALARSSDWQATGETVCAELSRALDVSVRLLAGRDGELVVIGASPPDGSALDPVDRAAAEWAWTRGEVAGRDTGTLGAADWQFHPLTTTLGTLAVVALARADGGAPVPAERATLLSTLLGQAALSHERLALEDRLRDVSLLQERDRLRAALLSSIGHDLRTPLTAVGGAIDAIAAAHPHEPAVPVARAELSRLRRFLDNLLEMVRIDTGALHIAAEPTDLTDAVASAVHDLRDLIGRTPIDLRVPPDLPLVAADPTLLHHILINLLANAATHGSGPIVIAGRRTPDAVLLSVTDHGPGLPAGDADQVFAAFARGTGNDRRGGSGLGLAIARGFVDAMGLGIAASGDATGATFTISFPAGHGGAPRA